MGNSDTKTSSG